MQQSLNRRSGNGRIGSSAPASDALRQRVLASVHGEPERRGLGLLTVRVLAALVVFCSLAFVLKPSTGGLDGVSESAHASLWQIGHRGELDISGLREPPIGEVYEVWLGRAGRPPQPTDALFTVSRGGDAAVDVPSSLRGLREVLVTAEPLGGSASPTSPPVLRVVVAHSS